MITIPLTFLIGACCISFAAGGLAVAALWVGCVDRFAARRPVPNSHAAAEGVGVRSKPDADATHDSAGATRS